MAGAAPENNEENNKLKTGLMAGLNIAKLGGNAVLGVVKIGLRLGGIEDGVEIIEKIQIAGQNADDLDKEKNITSE